MCGVGTAAGCVAIGYQRGGPHRGESQVAPPSHHHTLTPSHPQTVVVYIPTLTLTHTIALLPLILDVLSSRPFAVRHSSYYTFYN